MGRITQKKRYIVVDGSRHYIPNTPFYELDKFLKKEICKIAVFNCKMQCKLIKQILEKNPEHIKGYMNNGGILVSRDLKGNYHINKHQFNIDNYEQLGISPDKFISASTLSSWISVIKDRSENYEDYFDKQGDRMSLSNDEFKNKYPGENQF